jgi:hypothetical protein
LIIGINTFTVQEVNLEEIGAVFFATASLCGGTKLMYATFLLLDPGIIESDKIYTAYGGFCVAWVSFQKLKEKISSGQKKIKRKI